MNKRMFVESCDVYSVMPQIGGVTPNKHVLEKLKKNLKKTCKFKIGKYLLTVNETGDGLEFADYIDINEEFINKKNRRLELLVKEGLGACFKYTNIYYGDLNTSLEILCGDKKPPLAQPRSKKYLLL